jgi:hypothetical protein
MKRRNPKAYLIPRIREVVRLRDAGMSYRAIGEIVGCSTMNVWKLTRDWTGWVHERRISGKPTE